MHERFKKLPGKVYLKYIKKLKNKSKQKQF